MSDFVKSQFSIKRIGYAEAMDIVVKNHYLRRKSPCSNAFGLFREGEICGVVVYGTPSSAPLRRGVAGPEYAGDVAELTRLWCSDAAPRNSESFLVGNTIKMSGKPIIVSYADASVGHVGYVYQATNWLYTGLSAKRTNWTIDGINLHCQTIADKYSSAELREKYGERFFLAERPRKHRYLYINARGRLRKEIIKSIRYPILPYPKSESEAS